MMIATIARSAMPANRCKRPGIATVARFARAAMPANRCKRTEITTIATIARAAILANICKRTKTTTITTIARAATVASIARAAITHLEILQTTMIAIPCYNIDIIGIVYYLPTAISDICLHLRHNFPCTNSSQEDHLCERWAAAVVQELKSVKIGCGRCITHR